MKTTPHVQRPGRASTLVSVFLPHSSTRVFCVARHSSLAYGASVVVATLASQGLAAGCCHCC